jgi:hypothetical protein
VITGFNTDIEYDGVIYHVQTEDKGLSRPVIMTLVYIGGTILASKRSPYDDLLAAGLDEKQLAERLTKQHRLICAAVQAGRIEDLKKMTAREAAAARNGTRPVAPQAAVIPANKAPGPAVPSTKPVSVGLEIPQAGERPIPKPAFAAPLAQPKPAEQVPIIDPIAVLDDEFILPADAVAIIDEPVPPGGQAAAGQLAIDLVGDVRFRGGQRVTVTLQLKRNNSTVAGAQVMAKILGSSFRPVIFHAQTDARGMASINVQVPNFSSGRAAFLVRALANGEEVELRRSVAQG